MLLIRPKKGCFQPNLFAVRKPEHSALGPFSQGTGKGNLFVIFGEPDIDLIHEKDGKPTAPASPW